MITGSAVLRIGLGLTFVVFAVFQVLDPVGYTTYLPSALQGPNAYNFVYLNAAIDALLGLTIFFSLFGRIPPLLGAIHLAIIAVSQGVNDVAARDFGLAMACLALVFIHEEHIPTMAKRVMARMFTKR